MANSLHCGRRDWHPTLQKRFFAFSLSQLTLHYYPIRKELSTSLIKHHKYLYYFLTLFSEDLNLEIKKRAPLGERFYQSLGSRLEQRVGTYTRKSDLNRAEKERILL